MINNMPEVDAIPQIKPNEQAGGEESILVPKIGDTNLAPATLPQATPAPPARSLSKPKRFSKTILLVIGGILLLLLLTAFPILNVYKKAKNFAVVSKGLVAAAQSQNIPAIKAEIGKTKTALKQLDSAYKGIAWAKFVPFVGYWVRDGEHGIKAAGYSLDGAEIALSAAEPYLDILGFGKGKAASDGAKTTKERIDFVVKAIPGLIPKVGDISQKMKLARAEVDQINPDRYPVRLGKRQIREPLKKYLNIFDQAVDLVDESKPLLEAAPYLLGIDGTRQYLVLFQNDKEIRPTGGFMTAYSIMKVDNGKFEPVLSSDIYDLDAKYRPTIPAPDPIVKYIQGPYTLSKNLRLRDMNWSPDFAKSMELFSQEAQKAGVKGIDGIFAVDTQTLVYLLDAIGPIGVPGFGNFSTQIEPKCDCPQVIYELESFASMEGPVVWSPTEPGKIIYAPPNYNIRKKIIGPLMNSLLANAMGQPKDKLPKLFEAGFKALTQKHVLFYLFDAKAQAGVESFGIAGRIKDYGGDYLHINDANLGGRKSNLYATQEVEQDIVVGRDGSIEKTVTITYKNPMKQDGWLNSILPNWVRIYVPNGSTLVALEGLDDKATPYEDLGKTVFAGFFKLRPEGVSKVTLKYKLPFKASKDYKMLIQKQPGTDKPLYVIKFKRQEQEFSLTADKEIKLPL